jgi:RHS repeat-associated protein
LKYTYDAVGERTKTTPSTAATTYAYDQAGNLLLVERPAEGKIAAIKDSYTYDGHGLRVSQTIGTKTSHFAWDLAEPIPQLLTDGTNNYIYGPGGLPIEQVNSESKALYLHHDQQGSTRMLTSSTGANEAGKTYDAYGNTTATKGTATTPLGYDGQYTSSDTGLIYLRARTYDPGTAQFLIRDPLVEHTKEPYSYTSDNPLSGADPTGLCNSNPLSGSFWTEGNCLSGAVGGPNGGGSQPWWWDVPAYGALAAPCAFGGEAACAGAAGTGLIAGSYKNSECTAGTVYPNFNDPTQPPGPGWEWKGNGPVGSKEGQWVNSSLGQKLHPDLEHLPPKPPHYGYEGPNGEETDLFPGDSVPEVPEL